MPEQEAATGPSRPRRRRSADRGPAATSLRRPAAAALGRRQISDDDSRPVGRSRRQVADWGVEEGLFDSMPGRRFERRGAEHGPSRGNSTPRGGAADGEHTIVITENDVGSRTRRRPRSSRARGCVRARRRHDEVWAGDEPFAEEPADGRTPSAIEAFAPGGRFAEEAPVRPWSSRTAIARGGVEGRRTVKIGGRPAEFHPSPARRFTDHPDGSARGRTASPRGRSRSGSC